LGTCRTLAQQLTHLPLPPPPQLVYPARKLSADKRPRIKGRFVTKSEFEQMLAAQVAADRAVPFEA
jgi:hypothetical protein